MRNDCKLWCGGVLKRGLQKFSVDANVSSGPLDKGCMNDDICEALIWEIQDGECTLCDSKNVQLSLVDLCVSISEKIDDKARLHSWISRKNVFIENEKCDIDTESKC